MEELEQIYRDIHPKLFTFFYLKTANTAMAEDLTQDVFYEASKSLHRFNGQSTLSTWMFAIARNLLKKHYRSKKYEKALVEKLEIEPITASLTPEQQIELKEDIQSLLMNIGKLDPHLSEIILLRIYGDLSFKEIGELTGKSENYTRVAFHRLKNKLQKEMRDLNE